MAALSAPDRATLNKRLQRDLPRKFAEQLTTLDDAQFAAAVNAIDDWCEANQASFNSAIPLPARSTLSARAKAILLMYVVARRMEVL